MKATTEHPALTLLHALNTLHTICSSADRFRELAESRERTQAMDLNGRNLLAKIASDRANELARAGGSREQQWAIIAEGIDAANKLPPPNESAECTNPLRETVLEPGQTWCDRARAALRAGGAKGLDAATQPNGAGQARSIELHMKLQEVERVFGGLTIGIDNPRIRIDKDAANMADLGAWFARTRNELNAVIETRGLDAPEAIAPAPPPPQQAAIPPSEPANIGNEQERASDLPVKPWPTSEADVEELTYRIFDTELRDILSRYAAACDALCRLVEEQFSRHPTGCFVSGFDNPDARRGANRISALCGDAGSLVNGTIFSFGVIAYVLSEPLTCMLIQRPPFSRDQFRYREPNHMAATLGWMTEHERGLVRTLRADVGGPRFLENRESVQSMRFPTMRSTNADGEEIVQPAPFAYSDDDIAALSPILVKKEMEQYQLAMSYASHDRLRFLGEFARRWRPEHVQHRTLDPNWHEFARTYVQVRHLKLRTPSETTAPPKTGDQADASGNADEFWPASAFPKHIAARLRMAARPARKTKKVAKKKIDGVVKYSKSDVYRHWPNDFPSEKSATERNGA